MWLTEEFALLEASLAIARIVRKYETLTPVHHSTGMDLKGDARECCGGEPQTLTLVLSSAEGCWVRLRTTPTPTPGGAPVQG